MTLASICLDRAYFRHISDGQPFDASSFPNCILRRTGVPNGDLALWKFKMLFRFYGVGRRD